MRKKLDTAAIEKSLAATPAWKVEGDSIVRVVEAKSFRSAQALVNRICDLAEGAEHHPDLTWSYRRLSIALTTHDAGGLTALDFRLAQLIDALLDDL